MLGRAREAARLDEWLSAYRPLPDTPDELIGPDGQPRDYWRTFDGSCSIDRPPEHVVELTGVVDAVSRPESQSTNAAKRAARESATPLRRLGAPDDIGGIAVLLAGKAGAFITGQTIIADGGTTIGS